MRRSAETTKQSRAWTTRLPRRLRRLAMTRGRLASHPSGASADCETHSSLVFRRLRQCSEQKPLIISLSNGIEESGRSRSFAVRRIHPVKMVLNFPHRVPFNRMNPEECSPGVRAWAPDGGPSGGDCVTVF